MRVIGPFSILDLALNASTEEQPVKFSDARDYVANLHKAGYLVMLEGQIGGRAIYRLVPSRYSGPKPPMVQRIKQVWDPNLGKVVWSARDE